MEQKDNYRQGIDNSRLARPKRKLERLKREYSLQTSRVFDISQTKATADDLSKIFPNRPYKFDLTKVTNTKVFYQSLETCVLSEGLTIIDDLTTSTPVL